MSPESHPPEAEDSNIQTGESAGKPGPVLSHPPMAHGDRVMGARFLYRTRSDPRSYDASRGEMRGGPDTVIVYVNSVLCAMDREVRITIPVTRWKLAKIGVACF